MNYPRVSIIIINWNGWEDTIECMESLFQINYPNFDVILVDNASEDDSLEKIRCQLNPVFLTTTPITNQLQSTNTMIPLKRIKNL